MFALSCNYFSKINPFCCRRNKKLRLSFYGQKSCEVGYLSLTIRGVTEEAIAWAIEAFKKYDYGVNAVVEKEIIFQAVWYANGSRIVLKNMSQPSEVISAITRQAKKNGVAVGELHIVNLENVLTRLKLTSKVEIANGIIINRNPSKRRKSL